VVGGGDDLGLAESDNYPASVRARFDHLDGKFDSFRTEMEKGNHNVVTSIDELRGLVNALREDVSSNLVRDRGEQADMFLVISTSQNHANFLFLSRIPFRNSDGRGQIGLVEEACPAQVAA